MTMTANGVPAFLQVVVNENVPVSFFGIFSKFLGLSNSWQTVRVVGHCNCGLTGTSSSSSTTQSDPAGLVSALNASCNYGGAGSGGACVGSSTTTNTITGTNLSAPLGTVTVNASVSGGGVGGDVVSTYAQLTYSCNNGSTWSYIGSGPDMTASSFMQNFGDPQVTWSGGTPMYAMGASPATVTFTCAVSNTNQIRIYGKALDTLSSGCSDGGVCSGGFDGAAIGFTVSYTIPTSLPNVKVSLFSTD